MLVLEFVELDDFVAELHARNVTTIYLEIRTESGVPHGELRNAAQSAFAVATAPCVFSLFEYDELTIIRWEQGILFTDSISYRLDKERTRETLFANFEKIKTELQGRGFTVQRGQWKLN